MVLEPTAVLDSMLYKICFLVLVDMQAVLSKSNLRALLLNAARHRSSNVSRSVVGLRHLTKNVSAIRIELFVVVES